MNHLHCSPRPCPIPRASRRLCNTLWACPYCDSIWRQRAISGPGDSIWIWGRTELVAR
ncbi:hypothetical protein [Micromonospora sp. NPDC005806]|uniref:hypothetical protein n=1 Tax=Micromonospora sp. NPDC005806 TaxID=3364234 RepID=UPI003684B7DC